MGLGTTLCKKANRLFPLPVHPFNLQNKGLKTYGEWQFEKGRETIRFYLDRVGLEDMFRERWFLILAAVLQEKHCITPHREQKRFTG